MISIQKHGCVYRLYSNEINNYCTKTLTGAIPKDCLAVNNASNAMGQNPYAVAQKALG